ncbi:hypothetical protein ACMFRU_002788 [Vibrio cholerae]|uniref:hypothetical protein n=1 Tax=Vibrio cholerae TaxID=666 RepID=UPI0021AEC43D|nr:hypothetical protein [Vibrio cholerae]MDQ4620908.1 hypothetical protein [Vibrio cholerae]MDQ4694104.1 hypothetical protein [Vibrio cholerae]
MRKSELCVALTTSGQYRHSPQNKKPPSSDNDVPTAELITTDECPKVSNAYRWLVDNKQRTSKIISDAFQCVQNGRHPLVLTERREQADNHLQSAQVIVATGKYVGEGFDLPRQDTLFLAMPIAWKSTLAQYAGRIHREAEGKTQVTIHDYGDCPSQCCNACLKNARKATRQSGTSPILLS